MKRLSLAVGALALALPAYAAAESGTSAVVYLAAIFAMAYGSLVGSREPVSSASSRIGCSASLG